MKKLVSLVLSAALLVMAAIVPMCASAAYVSGHIIWNQDFATASGLAQIPYYSTSNATTQIKSWGIADYIMKNGTFNTLAIEDDVAEGRVLHAQGSAGVANLELFREYGTKTPDGYTLSNVRRNTIRFKVSGADENIEKRLFGLIFSAPAAKLATVITTNSSYYNVVASIAENAPQQEILYIKDISAPANTIPLCSIEKDVYNTIELTYTMDGNKMFFADAAVNGAQATAINGTAITAGQKLTEHGSYTHAVYEYQAYGRGAFFALPKDAADTHVYFSLIKSEELTEIPLSVSEVLIDGQAAALDGNDTMRPSGSMTVRFSEEPTAPTVTLTEGAKTRVAPQGTLAGSDYVIDFANTPLHPGSTYTLKVTSGTASKEITFKTSFNGYYINDNFATYQTGGLSKDGDYWHHTASVDGRLDHKIVEMPDGRKALQFGLHAAGIKAGYNLVSTASIQNNMLPQENMSTLRTVEMTFMFEEMDERTRAEIWTSNFYVQKDEQGVYKLFAGLEGEGVTTGGNAICSLEAGKEYTVRIVYSSANQYDRFLHRMDVTEGGIKTEYLQTEAGKSFVEAPCKIYQHGGLFGLELRYAPSGSTMLFGLRHYKAGEGLPTTIIVKQGADTAATPTNLYIYSVAYGAYAAEDKDFAVSATRTSAEEGVAVTLSAEDFRGETHKESIIFAAYTDNTCTKLADLAVIDINLPRLGKVTQTVTLTKAAEENTIKMIRLQDWGKVQPVGAAAVVVQ